MTLRGGQHSLPPYSCYYVHVKRITETVTVYQAYELHRFTLFLPTTG